MNGPATKFVVRTADTETTLALGETLGGLLVENDIVGLVGPLGAGKTWFTKGVAAGLGVDSREYVNSPAYDLVHEHAGRIPVFHMDLYRLDALSEYDSLWLDEYVDSGGVCIIEWADKLGHQFNEPFLRVTIDWDMLEDARTFTFEGLDAHYSELVRRLEDTFKC